MSSTVDIKMSVCDKKVKVTATAKEDGTIDIDIESDCHYIQGYADSLRNITMDDILNFETSKINKEEVRGNMSMICLTPIAVYQAAWMECGMMSKKNYIKSGPITMDLGEEDKEQ